MRAWSAEGPAAVSGIVKEITGQRAHTFAEWAIDHAGDFRCTASPAFTHTESRVQTYRVAVSCWARFNPRC
jgi:hypothetical protein